MWCLRYAEISCPWQGCPSRRHWSPEDGRLTTHHGLRLSCWVHDPQACNDSSNSESYAPAHPRLATGAGRATGHYPCKQARPAGPAAAGQLRNALPRPRAKALQAAAPAASSTVACTAQLHFTIYRAAFHAVKYCRKHLHLSQVLPLPAMAKGHSKDAEQVFNYMSRVVYSLHGLVPAFSRSLAPSGG